MAEIATDRPPSSRGRLYGAEEVQSILHRDNVANSEGQSPMEAEAAPLPTQLSRSASVSSRQSNSRADNVTETSKKNKRLTLTLPIQSGLHTQNRGPPSPTRSIVSATLPEEIVSPTGPTDSNFLTAIAAQERRVLELKEELTRAEAELKKLKRDWATHEAQKKRHDARKVQKMRPMSLIGPSPTSNDEDAPSSGWLTAQEIERRKALLNGTRASNRTVFSGSRHTRTLSLLSPTASSHPVRAEPRSERASIDTTISDSQRSLAPTRPVLPSRASTNPDLTHQVDSVVDEDIDLGLPREVLIRTGRQMASDFKDGLWTFIEDLRQATVGEEGVNGSGPRKVAEMNSPQGPNPARTMPPPRKPTLLKKASKGKAGNRPTTERSQSDKEPHIEPLIDIEGSFWEDNGLDDPAVTSTPLGRRTSKNSVTHSENQMDDDGAEGWDMWDSPVAPREQTQVSNKPKVKSPASTKPVRANSTNTHRSVRPDRLLSPGTKVANDSSQSSIPWPALVKLSPGNLRRTASHLMDEWEKSLTPPADDQSGRGEYIDRSPSPIKES